MKSAAVPRARRVVRARTPPQTGPPRRRPPPDGYRAHRAQLVELGLEAEREDEQQDPHLGEGVNHLATVDHPEDPGAQEHADEDFADHGTQLQSSEQLAGCPGTRDDETELENPPDVIRMHAPPPCEARGYAPRESER